ncbi:PDF receptor-like isoform X2 [Ptychodera flava]
MATQEACTSLNAEPPVSGGVHCSGFWERLFEGRGMCWPWTSANTSVNLPCPDTFGFDSSQFATRYCQDDGEWVDFDKLHHITVCIDKEIKIIINSIEEDNATKADLEFLQETIHGSKILEIVGYSISLTGLFIALFIFCYFRSLQCDRTTIHKQLFLSLLIRTIVDIILYVDNVYRLDAFLNASELPTIAKVKGLCETFECIRQYTRFCVFTWMFVEGLYLNGMITAAVFQKPNFKLYHFIGWVVPIIPVTAWAITMHYKTSQLCWFGAVHLPYYWIIEAPRLLILFINLAFLINIIRILVTKLRESNTSETQQVRKAVKAAILLAPLLGVISLLFLFFGDGPKANHSRVVIVVYFYGGMLVTPFQGFLVVLLHCFMHGEVRMLIRRKWAGWRSTQRLGRRRMSSTTTTDVYRVHSIHSTETSPGQWARTSFSATGSPNHSSPTTSMTRLNPPSPSSSRALDDTNTDPSADLASHLL